MACDALPLRTPRKLIPTVEAIAKDPDYFLEYIGNYDLEPAALVYGAYVSGSQERAKELESFEWGAGPAPAAEATGKAARRVIEHLEDKTNRVSFRGGQEKLLQHSLARDLAETFVKRDG